MTDRYQASGTVEGQYQPGSNERVLRNKLGITDPAEMDDIELDLLEQLYDVVLGEVENDQVITVEEIFEWHRKWLGNVYEWAGNQRSVNLAKDDFHFASARQIPYCLKELDEKFLSKYTPCFEMDDESLIEAIAVVHVELIIVHPFREGNGRISRLLANVMALQANKPELDYSSWDLDRDKYFSAIQAGMDCNYESMKQLVRQALRDAEQTAFE
ncbi:Fic family protein [Porticoccaceae bacterium LTM1]|nr:Fic family protein [Porticoccaceae bacterium LTM1]